MRYYDKVDYFLLSGFVLSALAGIYQCVAEQHPWQGAETYLMGTGLTVTVAIVATGIDKILREYYGK